MVDIEVSSADGFDECLSIIEKYYKEGPELLFGDLNCYVLDKW